MAKNLLNPQSHPPPTHGGMMDEMTRLCTIMSLVGVANIFAATLYLGRNISWLSGRDDNSDFLHATPQKIHPRKAASVLLQG